MAQVQVATQKKVKLDKISSQSFEHPADRAALEALKRTPGFERLIRALARTALDKEIHLQRLSSHVQVGPRQCSKLFALYTEVCDRLDLDPPPLYLANSAEANAFCTGIEKPLVVVTAGLTAGMTDAEVQYVLGHELGHFMAGHVLYRYVAEHLRLVFLSLSVGLGIDKILEIAIAPALFYWYRCSELTADRCGLLAVQEPRTVLSSQMKLAGGMVGRFAAEIDLDVFLEQTKEVQIEEDTWTKIQRAILDVNLTHPWPVLRAKEIQKWVDSGEYGKILEGHFIRRAAGVIADGPHPAVGEDSESGAAAAAEVAILSALARAYGVHVAPRIPEAALNLALGSYVDTLAPDERVLALYDETLSSSGDRGVVVTNRRLFAHGRPKQGVAFAKVTKLEDVPGSLLTRPGVLVDDLEVRFHTRDVRDAFKAAIAAAVEVHRASRD